MAAKLRYTLIGAILHVALASCAARPSVAPVNPLASPSDTVSKIDSTRTSAPSPRVTVMQPVATSVATFAATSTRDVWPTVTLVPATPIQVPSPTLDIADIAVQTPAPPAKCPPSAANVALELPSQTEEPDPDHETPILDFLNAGGSVATLRDTLKQIHDWFDVLVADVTNDTVPEVIVKAYKPYIFGCDHGTYKTLLVVEPLPDLYTPQIRGMEDMNRNGVPDLVVSRAYGGQTPTVEYQILEWDGQSFRSLVAPDHARSRDAEAGVWHGTIYMLGAHEEVYDTDENGTLELVLSGGISLSGETAWGWGPWRSETHTWTWNGHWFVLGSIKREPPKYRFQAVQDGDRAYLTEHYGEALASYQRAIEDETLDWWSPARTEYEIARFDGDPTDPAPPAPDPVERPRLAAYALYRIMLLYALRGDLARAGVAYQALKGQYGKTDAGRPYATMATLWWRTFEASGSVRLACDKAAEYAAQQSATILDPLGSKYYGWANRDYAPNDICPLTP